jgi:hypothetical protein
MINQVTFLKLDNIKLMHYLTNQEVSYVFHGKK